MDLGAALETQIDLPLGFALKFMQKSRNKQNPND